MIITGRGKSAIGIELFDGDGNPLHHTLLPTRLQFDVNASGLAMLTIHSYLGGIDLEVLAKIVHDETEDRGVFVGGSLFRPPARAVSMSNEEFARRLRDAGWTESYRPTFPDERVEEPPQRYWVPSAEERERLDEALEGLS